MTSKALREEKIALFGDQLEEGQCERVHREPAGPCEDLAMCEACGKPTFFMRPAGECFGHHAEDCSLPERHEGFCVGGGQGHETKVLRGWPEFTWQSIPKE